MYIFYLGTQIVSILVGMVMFVYVARARPSRIQACCMALTAAFVLYSLAFFIELTTSSVDVLAVACKLEYFGLCCMTVSDTWFSNEFCRLKIPKWVFVVQSVICGAIILMLFTLEFHTLQYKKLEMIWNGSFYQCRVQPGTLYWLPYAYFVSVNAGLIVLCSIRARGYKGIDKRRIQLVLVGLACPVLSTIARSLHLFNDMEITGYGLFGAMLFFSLTTVHLGYFDSVQAATDNVLDYGSEGLIVVSLDGEVLFINPLAHRLFPEIDKKSRVEQVPRLMELLKNETGEFAVGDKIYSSRVEDIREMHQMQARMVWLIDMTQYYEYTRQLKEVGEMAEAASNFKSAFLSNMSHEIRTPMNAVLGMNEMILREAREPNVQEYAHNIDRAGRTLLSIINDILDISKIEAGKLELVTARYEISAVINDVINMSYQAAHNKGLYYKVEVDPDIPYLLIGDEARIRQVLLNIVNNAVKYTQKGGLTLKCDYGSGKDPRSIVLCFSVSDTGSGIREEDMPKLFRSFERIDVQANRKIEGTGLGLTITKQLVDMMEGDISVESVFKQGSTFTVKLPQRVESFEPIGEFKQIMHSFAAHHKPKEHVQSFTAPEAEMLVVDDNEMNLMVVCGLLQKTQINIDTASGGAQAIEMAEKKDYDLILLDHMMPDMDGVETLGRLRESGHIKGVPVIALTANALTGARESYLSAGFIDYIPKPIDPVKLERMIASYLPCELVSYNMREDAVEDVSGISIDGVDVPSGVYYAGGSLESYRKLLAAYLRTTSGNLEKLQAYALAGDLDNYRILVHALKSTSSGIGADALAQHAAAHERKSGEGDATYVRDDLGPLLRETQALLDAVEHYLAQSGKDAQEQTQKPIDEDTLRVKMGEACGKLRAYDSEGEELLRGLLGYRLEAGVEHALERALDLAQDYEFDQSAEILEELPCMKI